MQTETEVDDFANVAKARETWLLLISDETCKTQVGRLKAALVGSSVA